MKVYIEKSFELSENVNSIENQKIKMILLSYVFACSNKFQFS